MTLSLVDVGTTANDGTGDPLRTAFQTVNTALTAVNNAVVVGTGTTTFKDDSGTYGVAVASNGDVTFTNAGGTVGATWDASANSNIGGLGIGTLTPTALLHISQNTGEGTPATPFQAVIQNNSSGNGSSLLILGSNTGGSNLYFGDYNQVYIGGINYDHSANTMTFRIANNERIKINSAGDLTILNDTLNIATQATPATASATGVKGDIQHDTNYIYVCTATNTWKRAAIATW